MCAGRGWLRPRPAVLAGESTAGTGLRRPPGAGGGDRVAALRRAGGPARGEYAAGDDRGWFDGHAGPGHRHAAATAGAYWLGRGLRMWSVGDAAGGGRTG